MKVQMQGQTLRLRVSEAELSRLLANEPVHNLTRLPMGMAMRQCVQQVDAGEPALVAQDDGWRLALPRALLQPYVARLPCREGLALRLPVEGGVLDVVFEVDVRDSVRQRGVAGRASSDQ